MARVELPTRALTRTKAQIQYGIEPGVHKIAVLRSNALGDFIFTLPALEALRHAYPEAEIVLLGQDWHASFLRGRPGPVNRTEVIPPMDGMPSFSSKPADIEETERFFHRMQAEGFDLAIQAHGGGRHSNPFIKRLGARLTVGARSIDAVPLDRWISYASHQMEILRQLEIVSQVGTQPTSLEPRLVVTSKDLKEASRLVPPSDSPLVVIHPGATDPRRRWPEECFAAVGNFLISNGVRVVLTGSKDEIAVAESVYRSMNESAINLAGRTTLAGLAGLLSMADLVISNDSGPLHLAAAVGAPTVGIYWIGNVVNYGPIAHRRHRLAVSWRMDCPVCGQHCIHNNCEHQESFVADVSTTEVLNATVDLLEFSQ